MKKSYLIGKNMSKDLKLKKGQLCRMCHKEIKKDWCYNGFYWHTKCKNKDTSKIIKDYLN